MSDNPSPSSQSPRSSYRLEKFLGSLIALVVIVGLGGYALANGLSPASIRHPMHSHDHFRLIYLNAGRAVNFGADAYQTSYNNDICSAALTKEPLHFHDHADQYAHIHWAGMTGGMLLKYYGNNLIGGLPATMGYRFDQGIVPRRVPIHGQALPQPPTGANYYVYTGTATSHASRNWSDFKAQTLETFFKNTPVIDPSEDATLAALDMTRADMNDVIGNVVIFVQATAPSDAQVTAQFAKLRPLPDSPCEG